MSRSLRYRKKALWLAFSVTVILMVTPLMGLNWFSNTRKSFKSLKFISDFQGATGSKANYSLPLVQSLVDVYRAKQQAFNSSFHIKDSQSYAEFLKELHLNKKRDNLLHLDITKYKDITNNLTRNVMIYQHKFYEEINQYELYNPHGSDASADLLKALSTKPITEADVLLDYVESVLSLKLDNEFTAVFKHKRYPIDHETHPNIMYFSELDRHNSEIAAFHLDRALGFYRAPPTAGRRINLTEDLPYGPYVYRHISPAGNKCFTAVCKLYVDGTCSACGNPDVVEGAMSVALPGRRKPEKGSVHPWSRSYNATKTAWELDDGYCQNYVKSKREFQHGRILLDFIDMAIFDFLMGNMDRSSFERFSEFGDKTFLFHIENGKGFGKAKYDCMSCLAPLRQCCQIRLSTLAKLIKLYQGPDSLSQVMRTSLNTDLLAPVLLEPHLDALDRRLGKVLKAVSDCIHNDRSWQNVVINDKTD